MKEFTKSYGIKRVAELTEEVETLRKWLDYYRKHDREVMTAYTEACNELAIFKFSTKCLLCEARCKKPCKAYDEEHCSIRLQIHYMKMAREKLEEQDNEIHSDSRE